MKTQRRMNKKIREHGELLAEAIKTADELEKGMNSLLESGEMKPDSKEHNDAKKTLKGLRGSIGLARRRSK